MKSLWNDHDAAQFTDELGLRVYTATRDLRSALQDKSTSADDIKAKLATVREARQKVRTDLEAAQKELKTSSNPRQEAALVLMGLLD